MTQIDNSAFWSEPCGYVAAKKLQLNLSTSDGIQKFDKWFFEFYPYLKDYLPEEKLSGKNILEVGIGSGSVSRMLAKYANKLVLLDIAPGAIEFVKNSINKTGDIEFICEDVLQFTNVIKFDLIVAIGSLHHTGDLLGSISKLESMLNNNGEIVIMVYNVFQPKNILFSPIKTLERFFLTICQKNKELVFREYNLKRRKSIDFNSLGEAAPIIDFSSRRIFKSRSNMQYSTRLENLNRISFLPNEFYKTSFMRFISRILGTNIYATGKRISMDDLNQQKVI